MLYLLRLRYRATCLLSLSLICWCLNPLQGQSGDRPNIIFILTDDQRFDALGYAGNKLSQTPEMDQLAKAGTYFKTAIVTTPICAASRASIFTGLHERTHLYNFQTGPIRPEFMETAYPRVLRESGYYTGFYGKFGVNYGSLDQLFDTYESYDRNNRYPDYRGYYYKTLDGDTVHLTRYTGAKALEFIDQAPGDRPFCLSLSFSAPHAHDSAPDQYFWQTEQDAMLADGDVPGPDLGEDRYFEALPAAVREGFNRTRWHWRYDTPEKYQHSVKGYHRMIAGIDREIGKIRAQLEKKGIADNTVIILMGDNGYFLGERQLAGKWLLYDNSIRVPLIVYDPRVRQHRDVEDMALNIDVPATMLDVAGVDRPASWQGQSLLPVVTGKARGLDRDAILTEHLWEFANIPPSEGIRTDDWKYFRYVNDRSSEELYDLSKDRKEINNLAADPTHRAKLNEMRDQLENLIDRYADPYSGTPTGLTVEYIRDPAYTTINDPEPEYGWILPAAAGAQSAYQILVASSREKIDQRQGDVWNSQQVRSNASVNVSHGGTALQPNTTYYWTVRIWDQTNRTSEYAEPQSFTTGNFQGMISSGNWFEEEHLAPVAVTETGRGSYFVDFGKAAFGTLRLNYRAPKSDTLVIRLGEKLENGRIDPKPGGTIRYQEVKMAVSPSQKEYRVELVPVERNTSGAAVLLPDSFGVIMPFRYAEIERAATEIGADDLRQEAYFYYFDEDESRFQSSDTLLNQIWDLCKYSIKMTSFAGLYVDGDRERIPYEADAYINQLGHYGTDREYAIGKQTIEYFMEHPTWPTEWLLHTALLFYQDYQYTGDTELIAKYYDELKHKSLMELAREDGLISSFSDKVTDEYMGKLGFADVSNRLRDIVDWPPAQKDTGWKLSTPEGERDGHEMLPINTVVNSFFYENMRIMAEFAALLNKPDEQLYFEYMAAQVKRVINDKLFDPEKGMYVDGEGSAHGSIHSNMMPLAFGIVPEPYVQSVVDYVKTRGMGCSVYGSQYLLEGLYRAGAGQYALDLMRATDDRSWWNMIQAGSTVTLEAWDIRYKPNLDWNHAWGAAPANIIPRYLWGVRPETPGFGIVRIQPQLGDLNQSAITVPTIRGTIEGTYTRVNNRVQRYEITLPGNTFANLVLQANPNDAVLLNGEPVNLAFGSIRLEPGVNQIELRINSF
ncbi:sulfatase-like hydrolase/transferase [Flavilitoribacter nigricans]|uniref:alpha-L-rhamnosidase n=1 Tax=Flavilitoribacter nigricans (strain ATCC 23147 / DSM 23189 / NBRC 102662 / NCIMB 1420 / SS-2) TaxID=1122177 RepID=A0A2D0NI30_FLAN2|nr:sulfatase-like hydrolase/transferase [Flavilitoribacter nigricans]PHN08162.1 acetylglucosamine-6-sulfatase [Flavilitoribacter nigricans DSM 23189 = NBRC 102662]